MAVMHAAAAPPIMLRLRHGAVRRGRSAILEPGALMLPWGARVAVVGLNGAGKTTLFLQLSGLLGGRRGARTEIVMADGNASAADPSRAFAPQQPRLPPWLRVGDVFRLYDLDPDDADAALPGLRLGELIERRVSVLSVGQAQAVTIALALAARAELTLLDEPLAALDFLRRRGVLDLLAARPRTGVLLLSAQSANDVLELCDWLVVLRKGRYAYQGSVAALLAAAGRGGESPASRAARLEREVLALLES